MNLRGIHGVFSVAQVVLLAACSSDPQPAAPQAPSPEAGLDGAPESSSPDAPQDSTAEQDDAKDAGGLSWQACGGGFSGACATVSVPLDYGNPGGHAIDVTIDLIASASHARAQLWLLQGGPGGSGSDLVELGRAIAQLVTDIDVYTLDHRGVNRSTRLECPNKPELSDGGIDASQGELYAQAWQPCVDALKTKWGDGLNQFTESNAARDLAFVIDKTRRADQDVFVYGVSYGTAWAQRYLQLFPEQPTAIVLDSVVAQDQQLLSDWDQSMNFGILHWIDACKADATCTAKLGAEPKARLQSIADLASSGHCGSIDPSFRSFLSQLFQSTMLGPYALAAMYRYERCAAGDVAALQQLLQIVSGLLTLPSTFSEVVFNHVAYSELWEQPAPSYEHLLAHSQEVIFPTGVEIEATLGQKWPVYPLDAYARAYPTTTLPVLAMNGTLDVQTPIDLAQTVAPHYQSASQHFVVFPGGNHGVITQSANAKGEQCGMQVLVGFLLDPTAAPDTSCLAAIAPPDFTGATSTNQTLLGADDMWENTGVSTVKSLGDTTALLRELARVRSSRL